MTSPIPLARVYLARRSFFKYRGSAELDIIFPRWVLDINRHNVTARHFYRLESGRRERLLPHKTKRNNVRAKAHYRGECRGFHCTIREPEEATSIFSTGRDREKTNEPRVGNRKHCRREMRLQRGLEMRGREGRTDCEERGRENGARGPWNSDVVGRFSDSFVWSTLRKGETDKKRRAGRPGEFLDSSVGGPCRGVVCENRWSPTVPRSGTRRGLRTGKRE